MQPSGPVGCLGSASCIDFDGGTLPGGWTLAGDSPAPTIDQSRAHSGSYALHFTYNGGDGYKPRIETSDLPDQSNVIHVRYFYYATDISVYYGTAVAVTGEQADGSYARFTQNFDGDFFLTAYAENDRCAWQDEDTYRASCTEASNTCNTADVEASKIPVNEWTCIETIFDGDTGAPTSMEVNGEKIRLSTNTDPWPAVEKWTSLEVGPQECHIYNTREVWLDDIALANSPIGCD